MSKQSLKASRLWPVAGAIFMVMSGCDSQSPQSPGPAAPGASELASRAAVVPDKPVEPCALLTDSEVQAVVPQAEAGKRDVSDDPYGVVTCIWQTPKSRVTLQVYPAGPGGVQREIQGLSFGLVDPKSPDAASAVRLEALSDFPDGAVALAESKDAGRGIRQGNAIVAAQSGSRVLVVTAPDLADGPRAAALEHLERLARAAVARM